MGDIEGLISNLWPIVSSVVTLATAITMFTPTKNDDMFLGTILRIANTLAGNVLQNKNKDDG